MYRKEEVERIVKEIVQTGDTKTALLSEPISLQDLLRFTEDTKALKELLLEKLDKEHQRQRKTIETVFDGMNEILRKVVVTVDNEVKLLKESLAQETPSTNFVKVSEINEVNEKVEDKEGDVDVLLIDLEKLKLRYSLRNPADPISLLERRIMCIQEYLNVKPENRDMTGKELCEHKLIYNHYITRANTRVWNNRSEFLQDVEDYKNKVGFWSTVTIKFVNSKESAGEKV